MSVIPHFGSLFDGLAGPISTAVGIGTDLIKSRIVSKQQERMQRRLQNSSAELQFANAMKMADYNSPANMRQRMEAAGYNVGAQMGQLSGTQGQLGSAPSGGPATSTYSPLSESQIALNKSAARLNDAKAQTESTTQTLQSATAGLQLVLTKLGVTDEKLKAVDLFIRDHTKYNEVGLSSSAFKTALLNIEQLQQDIFNKRTQGRLLGVEVDTARQNLVKLGIETFLAGVSVDEKQANIGVLRSLANYYANQAEDLAKKNSTDYWEGVSAKEAWQAGLNKRRYHWMPVMNISQISFDAVNSACKALGIVLDFKTLGLTRTLKEARFKLDRDRFEHSKKPTYTERYDAGGAFVGGSKTYRP